MTPYDEIVQAQTMAWKEKDFLYGVLNLPNTATSNEIRERHRALSIIFHPDKQTSDQDKEVANRRFLEVQRAYEVLMDPFLREVYDLLGEDGLARRWAPQLRSLPPEQLREVLRKGKQKEMQHALEDLVRPRGHLTCAFDLSAMFEPYLGRPSDAWHQKIVNRFEDVHMSTLTLRHSIRKRLTENTAFTLAARVARRSNGASIFGTIFHRYNSRWSFEGTASLLSPMFDVKALYSDDDTMFAIRSPLLPALLYHVPPPITFNLSRRLFRHSPTQGSLAVTVGLQPSVSIDITTPTPFDLSSDSLNLPPGHSASETPGPGSEYGFQRGSQYWNYGVTVDSMNPLLRAEWGLMLSELSMQLKLSLHLGLTGLGWLWSGTWSNEDTAVTTSVNLHSSGVSLSLELSHLEQRLSLPITLSSEYDSDLALWTAVLPSAAMVLGYQFIIQPRRRAKRAEFIRAARRAAAEEKSAVGMEAEATTAILKETARKHMAAESASGGLCIVEAYYGSTEKDENGQELMVDVTIPVQALVHHSQLHLPGHRTKASIQGFSDPCPFLPKVLRVRYEFRGRMHYAEIPDYLPVVLPLADHLVQ